MFLYLWGIWGRLRRGASFVGVVLVLVLVVCLVHSLSFGMALLILRLDSLCLFGASTHIRFPLSVSVTCCLADSWPFVCVPPCTRSSIPAPKHRCKSNARASKFHRYGASCGRESGTA